jgi:hypothetical protein
MLIVCVDPEVRGVSAASPEADDLVVVEHPAHKLRATGAMLAHLVLADSPQPLTQRLGEKQSGAWC